MNKNQRLDNIQLLEILSVSKGAIAIYSTEDIIIEFATDEMISFWGKDRSVIGKSIEEALPELKGQPFTGILKNVFKTGISSQGKGVAVQLIKNGELQTFYFDYEYRAIKNEKGITYCILHTASDVTDSIIGKEALEQAKKHKEALEREQALNEELVSSNEELQQIQEELSLLNAELEERVQSRTQKLEDSEARLRYMFADAPVAIAVLTGPDYIIESVNKKILSVWGNTDSIVGKPLYLAIPELAEQEFLPILDNVYKTGEPYYGNEEKVLIKYDGFIKEEYSNFVYQPLKDKEGKTTSVMLVANIVTEQVKARQIIEENAARFRFMLSAIPQQVWTATPVGALDYVNQVICNDFGGSSDEIVGHGWQKYIHPDDLTAALKIWHASLKDGKEYMVEFRLLFANGQYFWHLARALPFIENGKIKMWIGTNTNIEIQKENEQKKDEFISIASHELKTPLTSIKAYNQLINRITTDDKLSGYVKKSADHIDKLERLINDLLDVTKINAGKINYTITTFNFKTMLLESIENVQHATNTHQIILQETIDIEYTGDQFRLEQVMNNFLTNAIKYSPNSNKVIVNCKLEYNNIIVSVQDFGIGIKENDLDHLFDRYYRVDNTAMRFEGLGLGLFISSEILKRHQGNFWIDSELGKGSTFYFQLPLSSKKNKKVIKTDILYQDETIHIHYNEKELRLDVDWIGFQDLTSIKNGCLILLDFVIRHKVYKISNDNRNVLGSWSEGAEWVAAEFLPMLQQAGVKHSAWIYSDIIFNRLSANKSVSTTSALMYIQFFTDINEAHEWLRSK